MSSMFSSFNTFLDSKKWDFSDMSAAMMAFKILWPLALRLWVAFWNMTVTSRASLKNVTGSYLFLFSTTNGNNNNRRKRKKSIWYSRSSQFAWAEAENEAETASAKNFFEWRRKKAKKLFFLFLDCRECKKVSAKFLCPPSEQWMIKEEEKFLSFLLWPANRFSTADGLPFFSCLGASTQLLCQSKFDFRSIIWTSLLSITALNKLSAGGKRKNARLSSKKRFKP